MRPRDAAWATHVAYHESAGTSEKAAGAGAHQAVSVRLSLTGVEKL